MYGSDDDMRAIFVEDMQTSILKQSSYTRDMTLDAYHRRYFCNEPASTDEINSASVPKTLFLEEETKIDPFVLFVYMQIFPNILVHKLVNPH